MKYFYFISVMMTAILWNMIFAQDFSGRYVKQTENGELSLTFENKGSGNYTGSLAGNGNTFLLQGNIQNGLLRGTIGDELDVEMNLMPFYLKRY
jgi:hypothetical protein